MSEAFGKFKTFNFEQSAEWRRYFEDLLPIPNSSQIEKFKRKWYKKAIDPLFDVDFKENN